MKVLLQIKTNKNVAGIEPTNRGNFFKSNCVKFLSENLYWQVAVRVFSNQILMVLQDKSKSAS